MASEGSNPSLSATRPACVETASRNSLDKQQHTTYSIHKQQYTQAAVYTSSSIHKQQYTQAAVYTSANVLC